MKKVNLSAKTQSLMDDFDGSSKNWGYFTESSIYTIYGIDAAREKYNNSKEKLFRRLLFLERKVKRLEMLTKDFREKREMLMARTLIAERDAEELKKKIKNIMKGATYVEHKNSHRKA